MSKIFCLSEIIFFFSGEKSVVSRRYVETRLYNSARLLHPRVCEKIASAKLSSNKQGFHFSNLFARREASTGQISATRFLMRVKEFFRFVLRQKFALWKAFLRLTTFDIV